MTDEARRPSRIRLWILLGLAVVVAVGVGLWWWLSPAPETPLEEALEFEEPEPQESVVFTLYFPGRGERLGVEERELAVGDEPRARARTLVLALLDGPRTAGLVRPFPERVGLHDIYLTSDGVAFVDLGGEDLESPPPSGSMEEMLRVYSLVQTLTANLPEVQWVAVLWNGVQRQTFSGHLDTSRPLGPKPDLLSAAARRAVAG